ncbi:MAG: pyruvate dehydrogenase, partial [Chloroflexi bacterium]|nr:pyruvate dehydrogenase [Chloroflexota bacterium]
MKVGGHQTSSSSVVTILTYLYFEYLEKYDYVSVKPHASPVFHAIQYLLDNLDKKYLTSLRELHGLQSYPSRTKDPDFVDFSGGSVGIGSIAPNFAAISHKYLKDHSLLNKDLNNARFISLLGDAELDEGTIWEAIADPTMEDISNVIWIVDLNRQSLDRIIPFIRVKTWRKMFEANGWNVIDAKYGKKLEDVFNLPNGELMKDAIDDMPNELYQRLLRKSEALREWLPKSVKDSLSMEKLISDFDEEQLYDIFSNLGGHDFYCLDKAFKQASKSKKPTVIFAYTLKGWNLPSVGDPQNHSVILNDSQINELSSNLNIDNDNIWAKFNEGSPEDNKCIEIQSKLTRNIPDKDFSIDFPKSFKNDYKNMMSSQQIFGLLMTENSRLEENIRNKFVSISPDVASSTNLGGWINKMGIWQSHQTTELPEEDLVRALNWEMSKSG